MRLHIFSWKGASRGGEDVSRCTQAFQKEFLSTLQFFTRFIYRLIFTYCHFKCYYVGRSLGDTPNRRTEAFSLSHTVFFGTIPFGIPFQHKAKCHLPKNWEFTNEAEAKNREINLSGREVGQELYTQSIKRRLGQDRQGTSFRNSHEIVLRATRDLFTFAVNSPVLS